MTPSRFPCGHATHPQWPFACGLVLAQLRAQMALPGYAPAPALGLLYVTPHYAPHAAEILEALGAALPEVTDWSGAVGVGVCAAGAEYIGEPALSVMLCDVPSHRFRVFSGVAPFGMGTGVGSHAGAAHTALAHVDAGMADAGSLVAELASRTSSGRVFGGLAARRGSGLQFAWSARSAGVLHRGGLAVPAPIPVPRAAGVFAGGLSGVAFARGAGVVTRVAHGCRAVAPRRRVTGASGNVLLTLDGEPALDVLLADLGLSLDAPIEATATLRRTLMALGDAPAPRPGAPPGGPFGADAVLRQLIGLDPLRRGVALAEPVDAGQFATPCEHAMPVARAELMRACAELREALEPQEVSSADAATRLADAGAPPAPSAIRGALYVSCASRGGSHFGAPGAELQALRHALGDVPLTGFFTGGEIAGRHIHGYTGVLTVFVDEAAAERLEAAG